MRKALLPLAVLVAWLVALYPAAAQQQQPAAGGNAPAAAPAPPLPYGMPIRTALAKKIAAAALARAEKNGYPSAVAIVGPNGELIYFERNDNANTSAAANAQKKAASAATFRRATKFFEDRLMSGGTLILALEGADPVGGGIPIEVKGHIVGGIGVAGAPTSTADGDAAQAGLDAVK